MLPGYPRARRTRHGYVGTVHATKHLGTQDPYPYPYPYPLADMGLLEGFGESFRNRHSELI